MENLSCDCEKLINKLEVAAMFKKKEDSYYAYMDIQSGSEEQKHKTGLQC